MSDFIFQQKEDFTKDTTQNRYYCLNGSGDEIDDEGFSLCSNEEDKRICAKKIIRANGTIKYMIKTGEDKKLYNPVSIYDNKDNKRFLETISRNQNLFKEVNYNSFYLYLRFLKTKNVAYLTNAEREI